MLGEAGESGARLCLGCRQGRQRQRKIRSIYRLGLSRQGWREKQKKRRLDKYRTRMAKVLMHNVVSLVNFYVLVYKRGGSIKS